MLSMHFKLESAADASGRLKWKSKEEVYVQQWASYGEWCKWWHLKFLVVVILKVKFLYWLKPLPDVLKCSVVLPTDRSESTVQSE